MHTVTVVAAAWLFCSAAAGLVTVSGMGRWRLRRLAKERPGEGFQTFAASIASHELAGEIAGTLYWYMQNWTAVAGFPVRATDLLRETLGMGPEQIEDAVVTIAALSGCAEVTRAYGAAFGPVNTVGDIARFLAPLAPAQGSSARRPTALRKIA